MNRRGGKGVRCSNLDTHGTPYSSLPPIFHQDTSTAAQSRHATKCNAKLLPCHPHHPVTPTPPRHRSKHIPQRRRQHRPASQGMPCRARLLLLLLLLRGLLARADVDDAPRGSAHHDRLGVEAVVVRDGVREPASGGGLLVQGSRKTPGKKKDMRDRDRE